jgi:hypothetical protein
MITSKMRYFHHALFQCKHYIVKNMKHANTTMLLILDA